MFLQLLQSHLKVGCSETLHAVYLQTFFFNIRGLDTSGHINIRKYFHSSESGNSFG